MAIFIEVKKKVDIRNSGNCEAGHYFVQPYWIFDLSDIKRR